VRNHAGLRRDAIN